MKRSPKIAARGLLLAVLPLCALLFCGRAQAAHLFEFYLDGYGGGMYGTPKVSGVSTPAGNDFFHDQSGGLLGARVGIELLYTDLYVQFDQLFNGDGAGASTLQAMLGWDFNLGCRQGPPCWDGLLGLYGGGIFAFYYTPHLPISRDQIARYGIGAEAQFGAEYHFNRYFVFQALGTFGYHYLFSGSVDVNSSGVTLSDTAHGFHLLGKLGFRFHLYAL